MPKANKLYVIGIGYRPLGQRAKDILLNAEVILASTRLFEVFKRYDEFETVKDRIKVINKVPDTIQFIKERFDSKLRTPNSELGPVVLLASGDPFFFGIGRRVCEEFGKELIDIIPDLSSGQQAFARVNEPWDDAFFISLHGGPDIAKRRKLPYEATDIPMLLDRYGKLGILTDRENNPNLIAKVLQSAITASTSLSSPPGKGGSRNVNSDIRIFVCEHLGYPDEKITRGTPDEIAGQTFADPNVVIIMRATAGTAITATRFGLRENEFVYRDGLITKDEVRAVSIHKLRLPTKGVLWDVGAGCGSIGIEAARLVPGIQVLSVERDAGQVERLTANRATFDVRNLEIVIGSAPEVLEGLPVPQRVFIGGSGGDLEDIVAAAAGRMAAGIIVINAATLDTLHMGVASLERSGFSVQVSEISVSRSKVVAGKKLMTAMNPVFVISGERG